MKIKTSELAKLERYGFMLSRGALVPVGWVAVPVEPTEAMRSVIINESVVYQSPDALYAALLAAALKLREKRQPLSPLEAIKLGMKADDECRKHARGTTNWACAMTRFYETAYNITE